MNYELKPKKIEEVPDQNESSFSGESSSSMEDYDPNTIRNLVQ